MRSGVVQYTRLLEPRPHHSRSSCSAYLSRSRTLDTLLIFRRSVTQDVSPLETRGPVSSSLARGRLRCGRRRARCPGQTETIQRSQSSRYSGAGAQDQTSTTGVAPGRLALRRGVPHGRGARTHRVGPETRRHVRPRVFRMGPLDPDGVRDTKGAGERGPETQFGNRNRQ